MYTSLHRSAILAMALSIATGAAAKTPLDIRQSLDAAAHRESTDFAGFSAQRGEAFFKSGHGRDWSCTSCHTTNPLAAGRHAKTNKEIAPLAPEADSYPGSCRDRAARRRHSDLRDVSGQKDTERTTSKSGEHRLRWQSGKCGVKAWTNTM